MTREEREKAITDIRDNIKPVVGGKSLDMAIEALEQEPCEDAISRKKVLNQIFYSTDNSGDVVLGSVLKHRIENLPLVRPQEPKWIPVSERLPKDGQSVLFCDIDDDIMVGYHVEGRPVTHFSQDGTWEDMKNVKAWMPLPQPYKAESEE